MEVSMNRVGIDIGSTTVKIAIIDEQNKILFSAYERHYANIQETLRGIIERAYGSFEGGPQDAVPSDVWDPGDELVPFDGEGNDALASRMLAALADDVCAPGVGTLLAVSHGSASLQFIRATLPAGADRPRKLPNCAVMVFDFDEAQRYFEFRGLHDPAE